VLGGVFKRRRIAFLVASLLFLEPTALGAERGEVYDVLDLPAVPSDRAAQSKLFGISRAGDRLVAVGQRGYILFSDDWGDSWQQASVPVRATLLTSTFVSPEKGWAAGHDGVVLHTSDGGENWIKQLDGYEAANIGVEYYEALLDDDPNNQDYQIVRDELLFAQEQGADRPYFCIYFENDRFGVVLGAYGTSMRTFDGGASWEPTLENHADYGFRHLFDYSIGPEHRVVVGEMGLIWTQDEPVSKMKHADFDYDGSIYTIVSSRNGELIIAGLRGNAFRSVDNGESWTGVDVSTSVSLVASTRLEDGRIVLASQAGEIFLSNDNGQSFEKQATERLFPLAGIEEGRPGELVVVGLGGVRVVKLN
jgi:photosystem II stability/assembly factor-like uncharacterized protein